MFVRKRRLALPRAGACLYCLPTARRLLRTVTLGRRRMYVVEHGRTETRQPVDTSHSGAAL